MYACTQRVRAWPRSDVCAYACASAQEGLEMTVAEPAMVCVHVRRARIARS